MRTSRSALGVGFFEVSSAGCWRTLVRHGSISLTLLLGLPVALAQTQNDSVTVTSIAPQGNQVLIEWSGAIPPYKIQVAMPPAYQWADASYHVYQNNYLMMPPAPNTFFRVRTIPDLSAPPMPTGLLAVGTATNEIQLTWESPACNGVPWCGDNTGGTGLKAYRVYRGGQFLKELAAQVNATSDTSLQAGTTYTYTLTAVDKVGLESPPTAVASADTLAAGPGPSVDSVVLEWDPNTEPDLAGYIIYWRQQDTAFTPALTVTNGTSGTITGLQSGVTYFFVATAFDTEGLESDYSNEVEHSVQ